jgi:hypothetical protein
LVCVLVLVPIETGSGMARTERRRLCMCSAGRFKPRADGTDGLGSRDSGCEKTPPRLKSVPAAASGQANDTRNVPDLCANPSLKPLALVRACGLVPGAVRHSDLDGKTASRVWCRKTVLVLCKTLRRVCAIVPNLDGILPNLVRVDSKIFLGYGAGTVNLGFTRQSLPEASPSLHWGIPFTAVEFILVLRTEMINQRKGVKTRDRGGQSAPTAHPDSPP